MGRWAPRRIGALGSSGAAGGAATTEGVEMEAAPTEYGAVGMEMEWAMGMEEAAAAAGGRRNDTAGAACRH